MLRVRPWHRYVVLEVAIDRPEQMSAHARSVAPHIAVWVSVARTHTMHFRDIEAIATEKSKLVEGIVRGGIAVLNDDNEYIRQYQPPRTIETLYYGRTERSRCTPSNVSSLWPRRLEFDVSSQGAQFHVETRIVGEYWLASILPALAVGQICGIPLKAVVAAVSQFEPLPTRMSPVTLPNGATLLRDERNGSVDSMAAALKVLRDATAKRKMLVVTDVSDSPRNPRKRLRDIGRSAAEVAHAAVFMGEHCSHGARAAIAAGMPKDQVWTFYNIEDAARHLKSELRDGDLVLLRGRGVDHMARLYLSMIQPVTCWRNHCGKRISCELCPELNAEPRSARKRRAGLSFSGID